MDFRLTITGPITAKDILQGIIECYGPAGVAMFCGVIEAELEAMEENAGPILIEMAAAFKADEKAKRFIDKLHVAMHVRPLP